MKENQASNNHPENRQASASGKNITPAPRDWQFEAGEINVRKIIGLDGAPKLQMRLDLGLLQMELSGRPDGHRPHGCESLLEFFEQQLNDPDNDRPAGSTFQLT